MQSILPKVAAIHDLSCMGRCSLTVILPVLSALGVQACPLPTALLSTHLGGYTQVEFRDFTDSMTPFYHHWQRENIVFQALYSGFLASTAQIDVVSRFFDDSVAYRPLIVVDPVMGDHGELYSVYHGTAMQEQMRRLIQKAQVITPNYTEAAFLLEKSYHPEGLPEDQLADWARKLSSCGPRQVIITGIPAPDQQIATLFYDRTRDIHSWSLTSLIPAHYPGTGDIFAALITGALLKQASLDQAVDLASRFVKRCVHRTYQAGTPAREGVLLEAELPWLCREINDQTLTEGVAASSFTLDHLNS